MAELTYDWNNNTDIPMSRPDLSDFEVAGRVRMLMRHQLDHEAVCTLGRDRIMALSKEVERLREVLRGVEILTATGDGLGPDHCMDVHILAAEGRSSDPVAWRADPEAIERLRAALHKSEAKTHG